MDLFDTRDDVESPKRDKLGGGSAKARATHWPSGMDMDWQKSYIIGNKAYLGLFSPARYRYESSGDSRKVASEVNDYRSKRAAEMGESLYLKLGFGTWKRSYEEAWELFVTGRTSDNIGKTDIMDIRTQYPSMRGTPILWSASEYTAGYCTKKAEELHAEGLFENVLCKRCFSGRDYAGDSCGYGRIYVVI